MNQADGIKLTGTLAFTECCQRVLREAARHPGGTIAYAAGYAKAGLSIHSREAIAVQANYILFNLRGWRGDEARMVKAALKEFTTRD